MEDLLKQSLTDVAATGLTLVTTVVIPYGLKLLREWVKARTALIEDRNLREGIEFAFDRLDKTAETVVREIDQVAKKRVDGRVAQPEKLLAGAIARVYKRVPAQALQTMERHYSDDQIRAIVRGKIEAKVKAV